LHVTLRHETCFVFHDMSCRVLFHLVHPFQPNGSMSRRVRGELPGAVVVDGIKFHLHGLLLAHLRQRFINSCTFFYRHETEPDVLCLLPVQLLQYVLNLAVAWWSML
jgi:hypothetical protein